MDGIFSHRLTLISAPAGAGKTTQVSSWIEHAHSKGASVGWLALDEIDNDTGRFLEYLVACLEEGGIAVDLSAFPQTSGKNEENKKEAFLDEFLFWMASQKQEQVLILDDYHLIHNSEIHAILEYILDHAVPQFHLVLLTRSDPPLELARLRVAGQLVEIRMKQLRFSAGEAAAYLRQAAGVQLTDADADALNARTEGWIAGLKMAAISLRGQYDVAAFVTAFTGSHRFIFDYLLEQVLNRQTPAVREFLLGTSILDQFNASLCDALLDTEGKAREMLDALERANLFLVPLDDERGWYRYHHLFSDLLRLMLEQTHPGLSKDLHRRASLWFEFMACHMRPWSMH